VVVVVAGSLGGILIFALPLLRDRRFVQPSATAESTPPQTTVSNVSAVDEPPAAPTYPIPPEVIATQRAHEAASAPKASITAPVAESKRATPALSRARDRAPTRKVVAAPRGDSRTGVARGTAPLSAPPPTPPAAIAIARPPPADHAATPASSASAPAAENRKRIPLVDDQPRVRILE